MEKKQFTGKTLDDALAQAAKALGTEKTFVSYDVLPTAKDGGLFSKLFSRGVRVEAWVEAREDDLQAQAREAVRAAIHQTNAPSQKAGRGDRGEGRDAGRTPRNQGGTRGEPRPPQERKSSSERGPRPDRVERPASAPRPEHGEHPGHAETGERGDRKRLQNARGPKEARGPRDARAETGDRDAATPRADRPPGLDFHAPGALESLESFTRTFAKSFQIDEGAVKIAKHENGDAAVQFDDEFLEGLLAKTDRLALAFEHVFKRIAQKQLGDIASRVFVNAGNAEELRAEKLREMAFGLAEKVKTSGKTITLGAKSPQERRVIHLTLDTVEGVATRSIGTGDHRKLVIYSTERGAGSEGGQEGRGSRGGRNRRRRGGGGGQGGGAPGGSTSGRSGGGRAPAPAGGVAAQSDVSGVAAVGTPGAPQGGDAPGSGRRRRSRRRGGGGGGPAAGGSGGREPRSGSDGNSEGGTSGGSDGGSNGSKGKGGGGMNAERAVDAD